MESKNKDNYTFIAYKTDPSDMRFDFGIEAGVSKEQISDLIAKYTNKNKELDCNESGYEFYILNNGIPITPHMGENIKLEYITDYSHLSEEARFNREIFVEEEGEKLKALIPNIENKLTSYAEDKQKQQERKYSKKQEEIRQEKLRKLDYLKKELGIS